MDDCSSKPLTKILVNGQEYPTIPEDLFIPPDALEILLDSFSGPLDLLLYLIRKQNIDILNIPIVSITKQYLYYIEIMKHKKLELAADYLLMAATLAEIKSRMLLPKLPATEVLEEDDPRMALVRKLQAYEQIKQGAELIHTLTQLDKDVLVCTALNPHSANYKVFPEVLLIDLVNAMHQVFQKEHHHTHHRIEKEVLSVRERMTSVLERVQQAQVISFTNLFTYQEGRMGLIVSLLAILELARQSLLVITQDEAFTDIYLQAA